MRTRHLAIDVSDLFVGVLGHIFIVTSPLAWART